MFFAVILFAVPASYTIYRFFLIKNITNKNEKKIYIKDNYDPLLLF